MAPTDYRMRDQAESTTEQVSEAAQEARRRAVSLADDIAETIREWPYTSVAIAAGLGFAAGALWNLGQQRSRTGLAGLLGRLPELPGRDSLLPDRWR